VTVHAAVEWGGIKMNQLKRKWDGSGNALVTIVCIFIFVVVFVLAISPLQKLSLHNQLLNIERMALLRCEADGGMTDDTKQKIINAVTTAGLDPTQLTIVCTAYDNGMPKQVTTWGNEIELKITYNYNYRPLTMNGFNVNKGDVVTEPITIKSSTTAKN
jgi:hypothetical protein